MKKLENKTNVLPPNATYPYGAIQDNPGNFTGTPFNTEVYGDIHQFFARMFALSNLVSNNLPENAVNGFQYNQAFDITSRPFTNTELIQTNPYNAATLYAFDPAKAYKSVFKGVPSGGDLVVNLPDTTSLLPGAPFSLVHVGSFGYKITIIPFGTDAIGGSPDFILAKPGDLVQLVADPVAQEWNITVTNVQTPERYMGELFYGTSTVLPATAPGNLIVYTGGSFGFFALPALSAYDRYKKIKILNLGAGQLVVVTTGFLDVFSPADNIVLNTGDSVELEASDAASPTSPCYNIISLYRRSTVQLITANTFATGAMLNGWVTARTVKYRKNNDGLVSLQGAVSVASLTNSVILQLPAGYLPLTVARKFRQQILVNTISVDSWIVIDTAGVVEVVPSPSATDVVEISFDGINFYTD